MDIANQSLNLSHFVRRLVPRYLLPAESDGKVEVGLFPSAATMDWMSFYG